jgi:hypothetical protein
VVDAGEREAEEKTRVCSGDWRPGKQDRTRGEKLRGVGAHHLFFSQKSRCIATTTPYCLPSSMVTFDKGEDAIRCGLRSEEGDSSRREANTAWRGAVVADRGG